MAAGCGEAGHGALGRTSSPASPYLSPERARDEDTLVSTTSRASADSLDRFLSSDYGDFLPIASGAPAEFDFETEFGAAGGWVAAASDLLPTASGPLAADQPTLQAAPSAGVEPDSGGDGLLAMGMRNLSVSNDPALPGASAGPSEAAASAAVWQELGGVGMQQTLVLPQQAQAARNQRPAPSARASSEFNLYGGGPHETDLPADLLPTYSDARQDLFAAEQAQPASQPPSHAGLAMELLGDPSAAAEPARSTSPKSGRRTPSEFVLDTNTERERERERERELSCAVPTADQDRPAGAGTPQRSTFSTSRSPSTPSSRWSLTFRTPPARCLASPRARWSTLRLSRSPRP